MKLLSLLPLVALALPTSGQAIEDPGPFAVGFTEVGFAGTAGAVQGRVYYPALVAGADAAPDVAGGPYPLVAFQHGWLGQPSDYDALSTHVASWGFVLASIGTETGFSGTMQAEAQDSADLLAWVDAESDDPASFFADLVSDDPWSAVGHSMGGGALFYLIEDAPQVRTVVACQPWKGTFLGGSAGGSANLSTWDGDVLILGGSVDTTCPVATMTFPYFELCQETGRAVHVEVAGMGHLGPTDFPSTFEPLAASEQQRLHRLYVTGFLRAQVKGEEELFVELLGEGAAVEPVTLDADAADPIHWSAPSALVASTSVLGVAAAPGDLVAVAASLAPAAIPTAFGLLGIDLAQGAVIAQAALPAAGVFEVPVPTPVGAVGLTVYTQAVSVGAVAQLTATFELLLP